jgi:hypothetical protein
MHVDILVRRLLLSRLGWFLLVLVEVEVAEREERGGMEVERCAHSFKFPPNNLGTNGRAR